MSIHSRFLVHFRPELLDKVNCGRLARLEMPSLVAVTAGDGLVKCPWIFWVELWNFFQQ